VENIEGFPFGAGNTPSVPKRPEPPPPTVIGYVVAVTGNPVAVLKPPAPPPPPCHPGDPPPPATTRYSTVFTVGVTLETTKEPGDVKT
jgi:hypothetical protein